MPSKKEKLTLVRKWPVSMTVRNHLFPFRTQKLSSLVPKIVGWKRPVKIGRCRLLLKSKQPTGRAESPVRGFALLSTIAPDCRELAKYNGDTAGLCIKCLRSIKNKYKATDMKWLLVPEPPEASESKEENPLHVHGLLANVPPQAVHEWKIGEKGCPHSAKAIVMNGRKAAEIPAYSRKYGYNLLESITDLRKLLRYLLKSLDRAQEYRQKGQHLYYASRNVGRPQKLKAVPCTQAMQDKIEALAVDSYRHKQKDGKVVYGKTYVLPDTADTDILLSAIFQDIEE